MARFAGLEERGGEGKLVAAPQACPGPGRTTDVPAGQWRPARHTSGFRRGACRPEDAVCVWRRSLRQRRRRVALAARAVQPRQKALEQMQLKWTEVVSASKGKTRRTILRAILAGERAPQLLATSRDTRCQHDQGTSAKAWPGHGRAEPRLAWQPAGDQEDVLAQQWRACDGHSAGCLPTFVPDVEVASPPSTPGRPWRASRSNPLRFAGQASLEAMTGVDLPQIAGSESLTALQVLSARGLDRTRWPTRKPCAAWLG